MARPLEFNEGYGSHDAHLDLLRQRVQHTEAELAEAQERSLPTEEIEERLAALRQELEQFNGNEIQQEAA